MLVKSFFKHFTGRADLMSRMLEAMSIGAPVLEGPAASSNLRRTVDNCQKCRDTGKCQAWLEEQEVLGRTSEPTFCPNYSRFKEWEMARK